MKWNMLFGVALVFAVGVLSDQPSTAAEKTSAAPAAAANQATLQEKLKQRIDVDVVEMPLKDVCQMLSERTGIQIFLQLKKLEEASVSADTPITKTFKQVRLSTVLELMLKDLELTYVEKDGLLLITTPEDAEATMEIRVYDCRDILAMAAPVGADKLVVPAARPAEPKSNTGFDPFSRLKTESNRPISEHDLKAMQLRSLVEANVDADSWRSVGGPGEISEFNGLIVVTQTAQTHEKVERLLDMLRQAAGLDAAKPGRVVR
jgi:hypothetical protein